MAKRGFQAKDKTIADLPESLRVSIDQFIDSHRRNSCKSIFNRFGMADRGINFETFRKYVRTRRKDAHCYKAEEAPVSVDPYERTMELAIKRIDSGDAKHLQGISSFLRVLLEQRRVGFAEAAERRASELHEVKMTELRKVQDKALTTTAKVKGLTPEQVAEIRLKVLGLA